MDPKFLSGDEVEIECLVRNISGSILEQLEQLGIAFVQEKEGKISPPEKPHKAARKSPKRELDICERKLISVKPQIQSIYELNVDDRLKKLTTISTGILHVSARVQRIINTSPSSKNAAISLLKSCDKLLDVIQSLIESRVSLTEFDKSVSEAIPDGSGSQEKIALVKVTSNDSDTTDSEEHLSETSQKASSSERAHTKFEPPTTSKPSEKLVSREEYEKLVKLVNKLTTGEMSKVPVHENVDQTLNLGKHNMSTPQNSTRQDNVLKNYSQNGADASTIGIHKWNITFDGLPGGQAVERFFYRVERLSIANKISHQRLVTDLCVLLRKSALEWYWSFLERNGDIGWDELKQGMLERFKDRRTDAEIKQMIASIKQKPDECFMDFYNKIIDSTLALSNPLSDSDLYFIIKRNMVNALQYKIAGRQIDSVSELVHQCVEIEDTWKRLNSEKFGRQVHFRQVQEIVNDTGESKFLQTDSNKVQYFNPPPYNYSHGEEYQHHTVANTPNVSANAYHANSNNEYYSEVNAMSSQPANITFHYPRGTSTQVHDQNNWRNPNLNKHCYGCGAPNIIKPNCRVCNQPTKGNIRGEVRMPGAQPAPNPNFNRKLTEDVASNTCPELYRRNQ